jgi:hypothetical protein
LPNPLHRLQQRRVDSITGHGKVQLHIDGNVDADVLAARAEAFPMNIVRLLLIQKMVFFVHLDAR